MSTRVPGTVMTLSAATKRAVEKLWPIVARKHDIPDAECSKGGLQHSTTPAYRMAAGWGIDAGRRLLAPPSGGESEPPVFALRDRPTPPRLLDLQGDFDARAPRRPGARRVQGANAAAVAVPRRGDRAQSPTRLPQSRSRRLLRVSASNQSSRPVP
jgi:hypothetical protein